jgi:hypothetical protein
MEALLTHGEGLLVPERMIIAPSVGVFRPDDGMDEGIFVDAGQTFAGKLAGMLVHRGERLREGQPVAWLRVA